MLGVVLFFGSKATVVSGATTVTKRTLPDALSAAFCRGDFSFRTMWSFGLHDAQVEGLTLKSSDGKPVSSQAAMTRASVLAKETKRPGFAADTCEDGSAWVAVFLSPYPIELKKAQLNLSRYAPFCTSRPKVYFSDGDKGLSQEIIGRKNQYELPRRNGFVAVVCVDKERGPQEVFLSPTSRTWIVPGLKEFSKGSETEKTLAWINAIRIQNQRKPLIVQSDLAEASKTLSDAADVGHNMKLLNREAERLRIKHWELIGEDRVKAKTWEDALSLLWVSPVHRDLLLSEKASGVGLTILSGDDFFLQLVVGRPR